MGRFSTAFLVAALVAIVTPGLVSIEPAAAAGYTRTKEACRKLGGDPNDERSEQGYWCRTPKLDRQCARKQGEGKDWDICWVYNAGIRECEFDEEGFDWEDC
jgi:hypothetical protein